MTRNSPEIIKINDQADGVSCDGGDKSLGHPKVWYEFNDAISISCKYCGREFVKSS